MGLRSARRWQPLGVRPPCLRWSSHRSRLGATLLVVGYGLNLLYVWAVVDATQLIQQMDEIASKPLAIIAGVVSFGAWLDAQPSEYSVSFDFRRLRF
eukprot:5397363-Prymnesium_polylepis.1